MLSRGHQGGLHGDSGHFRRKVTFLEKSDIDISDNFLFNRTLYDRETRLLAALFLDSLVARAGIPEKLVTRAGIPK